MGIIGASSKFIKGKKEEGILNTYKNRFYSKILVSNENGCMLWIGQLNNLGYGVIENKYGFITAHRYSYFLHNGEFDRKLDVLHRCDIRNCIAPNHLFLGTQIDNIIDMDIKKRRGKSPLKGENHGSSKLTEQQVKDIKIMLKNGEKHKIIAEKYNVDKTTITSINLKRNWRHI